MSASWEQISKDLEKVKACHRDDRLLQASRILDSIQKDIDALESHPSKTDEDTIILNQARDALQEPPFPRIFRECQEIASLRESLHSKEGWTLSYDGSDTSVWYRRESHTSSHSILTEGTICAPLVHVAALLYEADLYQQLFWYVTSARTLKTDNPRLLRRAAHIVSYAPWPLWKRDVTLYAYAIDGLDNDDNCVMVVSRSMKDTDPVTEKVPKAGISNRTVRSELHTSGFELTPVAPDRIKARFLYNIDPRLPFIPTGLINWAARTLCRWSLRVLESRARDLNAVSPLYLERIAHDPIYEHVRKRLNEYWTEKQVSPSGETHLDEDSSTTRNSRDSSTFDANEVPEGPPPSMMKALIRGDDGGSGDTARRNRGWGGKLGRLL